MKVVRVSGPTEFLVERVALLDRGKLRVLPPFDENEVWKSLDVVRGATFNLECKFLATGGGWITQQISFVDGQATSIPQLGPDVRLSMSYVRRLAWRQGAISTAQLLSGGEIDGAWPVLSCLDGLCQAAVFAGRSVFAAISFEQASELDRCISDFVASAATS